MTASGTAFTTRLALRGSLATALGAGLLEGANAIRRHRIDHLPTGEYVAGEVFWMTPLAAVVTLGLLALLWLAITSLVPQRDRLRLAVLGIVVAVAAYGLLTAMSLGLADWSRYVLAAGLGLTAHRLFARWPRAMGAIANGVIVVGSLGVLTATVLPERMRQREEAARLAALPAPGDQPLNVLILIWDTARAQNMSLYGYERRTTPVLDSLARHGLVFDRAFATAPWSLPSHASIFTGRYPNELTAGPRIPLDGEARTLAEHFGSLGYATASMTANLFYGSPDYGIDRGFTRYDARPPITWSTIAHTWIVSRRLVAGIRERLGNHDTLLRRRASHVNGSFLSWLDGTGERPWLAVLNHFDAHEPYRAPAPFDTLFARPGARYWADETLKEAPLDTIVELRDHYDGGIAYVDHALGELIESLRERGQLERTVLVITSDHGEEFGERGPSFLGHNRSLYRQSLQVPLVLVGPPTVVPVGRTSAVVSIRDIAATVSSLARPGAAHPFPGRNLIAVSADTSRATADATVLAMADKHRWARRAVEGWPTSWGPIFSSLSSTHQFLVDGRGTESLYDLARDPFDGTDLAPDSTFRGTLGYLRSAVEAGVGPTGTRVARRGAAPHVPTPNPGSP